MGFRPIFGEELRCEGTNDVFLGFKRFLSLLYTSHSVYCMRLKVGTLSCRVYIISNYIMDNLKVHFGRPVAGWVDKNWGVVH